MNLVTGGTGLVGSHLLLDLVKSGEKVRATRRTNSDTRRVRKVFSYYSKDADSLFDRIEWVEADMMDYQSVLNAMEGVNKLYHCAAFVSFQSADKWEVLRTNIEGTANMVNAALELKLEKFGFVSSIAALGKSLTGEEINEELIWRPSRHTSAYSESKFKSEMEVWRGISEGMNAVIINPSVIIGPGNWESGSGLFYKRILKGMRYYTLGVNGYVDVRDVAMAFTSLMNSDISGERFIVSAKNLSLKDVFSYIAQSIGRKTPAVYASPRLTSLAQRFDALRARMLFSPVRLPREAMFSAHAESRFSSQKLRKALGFEFIPMENSFMETGRIFLDDLGQAAPAVH